VSEPCVIPRRGKIVTFYSYKGGTGRSMALANVAWVLASHGKRVLMIDWDFEAPGLHHYFRPFLEDPDLKSTPGLIDYFVDLLSASRSHSGAASESDSTPWWRDWTSLFRYAQEVEWEFAPTGGTEGEGELHLVGAGTQGAAYAARVHGFDWPSFYSQCGGGVILEALKEELRREYDYILIDSRTGISDSAGISTVQMPDDVVVLFTLNRQSRDGAFAAATSIDEQRRLPSGAPGVRIWPVASRIDLGERDRLEAGRAAVRQLFSRFVAHLSREERQEYWDRSEILHQPIFAYEEILAVFTERSRSTSAYVPSVCEIAGRISDGEVRKLAMMPEERRRDALTRFTLAGSDSGAVANDSSNGVFLSYPHTLAPLARRLVREMRARGLIVTSDMDLTLGDEWQALLSGAIRSSLAVAALLPEHVSDSQFAELESIRQLGRTIVPVVVGDRSPHRLPWISQLFYGRMRPEPSDAEVAQIAGEIRNAVTRIAASSRPIDIDDPQRGQWGGAAERDGFRLSATVKEVTAEWFEVLLTVEGTGDVPLEGPVEFYLHPTFGRSAVRVMAADNRASLQVGAYGAFTVGALVLTARVTLELDLASDPSFPPVFLA
jgi:hypothetical protein